MRLERLLEHMVVAARDLVMLRIIVWVFVGVGVAALFAANPIGAAYAGGVQCPPGECESPRPPPPTLPTPVLVVPQDNEDNRRRSALASCCIRKLAGLRLTGSVYCSPKQLNRAFQIGDVYKFVGANGSTVCAPGTGVVVSQSRTAQSGILSFVSPIIAVPSTLIRSIPVVGSVFSSVFGF